ncbi:hypothetical protein ACUN24_12235 [Pedobacter sp. WC2501]|uniref:hypothetical protein n=1 Tax=Pedobacter sp. WC2501 TaxID=3461400 RepID=UPI0040457764
MKKVFQSIAVLVFLFTSCNYSPSKKQESVLYEKDGLTFQFPAHWKVEKDKPIDGVAKSRFITIINHKIIRGQEFIIITASDSTGTLKETLDNLIKQSEISYTSGNIEFGVLDEAKEFKIGSQKVLRQNFETNQNNTSNRGIFSVFNSAGKTFSFTSMAEATNIIAHTAIVDSVIKSLKIK